jgi:transposase
MNVYAGLDVALRETSICIGNAEGKVVLERKVASEPDDIVPVLQAYVGELRQVGVERAHWAPGCRLTCRRAASRLS